MLLMLPVDFVVLEGGGKPKENADEFSLMLGVILGKTNIR